VDAGLGKQSQEPEESVTSAALPETFALLQNYPNPFNPETRISYQLSDDAEIRLEVYDMLGVKVRTLVSGVQSAGHHTASWNATDDAGNRVPSGVYLARMTARNSETNWNDMKKMLLLK
jgi:hypothetical protein